MMSRIQRLAVVALLTLSGSVAWSQALDRDGDGISDEHETLLGSDPLVANPFTMLIEDGAESAARREAPGYAPGQDVLTVEATHAGEDRFLWRVTFAADAMPEQSVLHLYVDADADDTTGRKGSPRAPSTGTEYMLSAVGGNPRVTAYTPDGATTDGPVVTAVSSGRTILISADIDVTRTDAEARFALYVLCHTLTGADTPEVTMSDSTRKTPVSLPVTDRPKIMRLVDIRENWQVQGTYGLDIVRDTLKRPDVVRVPYDKLQLDGFEVDIFTQRRYGHVKRLHHGGSVRTTAPRGRYHVGFLMYDDAADERVAIYINDDLRGMAAATVDNARHWIYWLETPLDLQGTERVALAGVGPGGKHGIAEILFLPSPPPIRDFPYQIENMHSYTAPGDDGRTTISWTSSMPTPTRFEYGATTAYGKVVEHPRSMLVHRVVLEDLPPDQLFHGRATGLTREGEIYSSAPMTFRARPLAPPPSAATARQVPLRVRNPHAHAAQDWPITMGVPIPQALLASPEHVRLLTPEGEIEAQIAATGYWLDSSVKWLLLTFMATVPPESERIYTLEFGRDVRPADRSRPALAEQAPDGTVSFTGAALPFQISAAGELVVPSGEPCRLQTTLADGTTLQSGGTNAQVVIEENGPMRAQVKATMDLTLPDGTPALRLEQRIEAFRGRPFVRVQHTFTVQGKDEFTRLEAMTLRVPLSATAWQIPLEDGDTLRLDAAQHTALQRFDREVSLDGAGGNRLTPGRMIGNAMGLGNQAGAVAIRHFWQNYPAALQAAEDSLLVHLCPDFEPGLYDAFPFEKEGHQLYYYLRDGQYSLKRGMAKTHELLLSLDPDPGRREAQAALLQRPLLAVPPPEWMCASDAFYPVAPRDESRFKAYEEAIDTNLARYRDVRDRQADYGMMNFGDWYGERGANWGNIEYDTQHAFMLEFIRSGNEDAFFLAHETECHNRDIDTLHWSSNPDDIGGVYVHQMGHVGGYYTTSVPGTLGIPKGGFTVSHAWSEGHFNHYFLTGDRRSLQTGRQVTDYFARRELGRPYDFTSCRVPGWHLIMNAAAYAATCDPYYLNASRVIVDRVVETQDPEPRPLPEYQVEPGRTHQDGGWTRMMVPGHCECIPRHRGNANFMIAVLLSGLKYYYDVTGEERVKQAIIRGARYLVDDFYSTEVHGFRYTSCPKTGYRAGASPLMVEAIARAYRWTGEEIFRDPLINALPVGGQGAPYGKSFSMYYRMAPRMLADLQATGITLNEIKRPIALPFKTPQWMTGAVAKGQIVVQAEAFTAEGGGVCSVRHDRNGAWDGMVTNWHRDEGHWLEWTLEVPADGAYAIRFHYATSSEQSTRELQVDGKIPFAAAKAIHFKPTGGFGHSAAHWQFQHLLDEQERELTLHLTRGTHTIRMTNLKDGLGLDFIILVPVPQ